MEAEAAAAASRYTCRAAGSTGHADASEGDVEDGSEAGEEVDGALPMTTGLAACVMVYVRCRC